MQRRLVLLAVATAAVLGAAASASAETSTNMVVPTDTFVFVPCTGDLVELTGPLHVLITETANANGVSGHEQFQPKGVTGTDLMTGVVYQGTGETSTSFRVSFTNGQAQVTLVNNFRILGRGSAANYLVHAVTHVTFNADGSVTADVSILDVSCS